VLANAMYAECRSRCLSDAARQFVNTVVETLEAYQTRKSVRRGTPAARFANTVEGFLGDLMLARDHPTAAGWVFRPFRNADFAGSGTSLSNFATLRADLEFLGLIERAPRVQPFGADAKSPRMRANSLAPRFRATFKLIAMARNAGVNLDALAKHFSNGFTYPS
jgi:hypothetical protein